MIVEIYLDHHLMEMALHLMHEVRFALSALLNKLTKLGKLTCDFLFELRGELFGFTGIDELHCPLYQRAALSSASRGIWYLANIRRERGADVSKESSCPPGIWPLSGESLEYLRIGAE